MSETSQLWVVVDDIKDKRRRYQVRDVLRYAGNPIRPGVFEIVTTQTRLHALLQEFAAVLDPDDELRIYRICANCREMSTVFGPGELSKPPAAIIV